MIKTLVTLALVSLAYSSAYADTTTTSSTLNNPSVFNYNYVEGSFIHRDDMGNGFNFNGSYDIQPNIALIGGAVYSTKNHADYTTLSFGGAYHQQIAGNQIPGLDLVLHAQLEEAFANYDHGNNDTDFGVRIGSGLRYLIAPKLETFGDVSLATTGGSQVFVKGGMRYYFLPNLAGVASYEFSNNNTVALGVSYFFE